MSALMKIARTFYFPGTSTGWWVTPDPSGKALANCLEPLDMLKIVCTYLLLVSNIEKTSLSSCEFMSVIVSYKWKCINAKFYLVSRAGLCT